MVREKENINVMSDMMKGITKVFLVVMIGVYPLYYQNKYFNIVAAKRSFFETVVIALLAIGIVFAIPAFIKEKKMSNAIKKLSLTDIFAILFMFTVIVSCLLSPVGSEAFLGTQGRQFGGKILLLCAATYFMVSRYYKSGQLLIWVFLISNCFMCILISLNFWGIDPLHMYHNIAQSNYPYFIGTLGNVDINSGYVGVISALFMGFYYLAEEKMSRRCFGGATVLGIYTCFATRCDSWLLAVGGAYLVILALAMKDTGKLRKWWNLCACFFGASFLMKLTEQIDGINGATNVWIANLRIQTRLGTLLNWKIFLMEMLLLGIFWCLLMRNRPMQFLKSYGNKILLGVLLILVVITAFKLFPLDDSFGSGRGKIWKYTISNVIDFPILEKVFGYGPNCYQQSMSKNYGQEIWKLFGGLVLDAHNEWIQFLTVIGFLGMISYVGMQISLLISCIRKRNINPLAAIGYIGITAYMLQGLVNNPQVYTTPLFFLFMGLMDNRMNRKTEFE